MVTLLYSSAIGWSEIIFFVKFANGRGYKTCIWMLSFHKKKFVLILLYFEVPQLS